MNLTNLSNAYMPRRGFIGSLSAGAAAIGLSMLVDPLSVAAEKLPSDDLESWFKQIKGKHRVVYDVPRPNEIFPFAWPRVFLITNEMTGTGSKDCSVVVVFRHEAIPYAMEDRLWKKYKFGEAFKINDPATGQPALRNIFWQPGPDDFVVPGLGPVAIGINQLQESGVMFCVCNMAITVDSAHIAEGMQMDPAEVRKDFVSGILPGIRIVPSGVWAVGRAQEHGCAYCFTG